ncbi:MAG TPA: nucleoside-diphosphate sugar epimerase/dehydratase [Trueperaceae bacterium]|nr:nucleoside-diphosphate sugar epimerase/dehydratase [Trueperaceae bacterium]
MLGSFRSPRAVVKLAIDVGLFLIATPLAFALRYDGNLGSEHPLLLAMVVLVPVKAGLDYLLGLPNRSWRGLTFRDLSSLMLHAGGVLAFGLILIALFWQQLGVGPSLALLDAGITFMLMAGVRAFARYRNEHMTASIIGPDYRKRVLVVGAGEAGALVVRELHKHPETGMLPVAFLDDDPRKRGQRVAGVPVVGTVDTAAEVIVSNGIDQVLIAMPSKGGRAIRKVIEQVREARPNLVYKIIPGMYEVLSGQVDVRRIREVDIDDLLGREPIKLDTEAILDYLGGKRVMITGAGGSIGSELVRQICRFNPAELILFGHGENSIYTLERELDRDWPHIRYHGVIGAIQNGARLDYVFTRYRPDVVFHAAAHKHVPLMEENPEEAVFNNVIGSRNLINLALKHGVTHFVNISTDKAVNPTSVMGASKRMVEFLVQDAARRAGPGQTFVSVRFGNVLGSRGSVIPIFKSQIAAGGPVTITHPEMVRYFMTIPEAAQLVLQASGNGRNGEVYILDMGEPVRIVDLARDLIRLSGFEPDVDIPIRFTGMRPGERLVEELMTEKERTSQTAHEKIFVARTEPVDREGLTSTIEGLQDAAMRSDHARIRVLFEGFLDGCHFAPVVPVKDSSGDLPGSQRLPS